MVRFLDEFTKKMTFRAKTYIYLVLVCTLPTLSGTQKEKVGRRFFFWKHIRKSDLRDRSGRSPFRDLDVFLPRVVASVRLGWDLCHNGKYQIENVDDLDYPDDPLLIDRDLSERITFEPTNLVLAPSMALRSRLAKKPETNSFDQCNV